MRRKVQSVLLGLLVSASLNLPVQAEDAADIQARCEAEAKEAGIVDAEDKAEFMTVKMESFFRSIVEAMAAARLLRLGVLKVDDLPMAAVMCFDYQGTIYLYNSGYDPRYSSLSVGILSKVLCIQDSIQRGRTRFDFLKGAEEYKYRLGGKEILLYNCQIELR